MSTDSYKYWGFITYSHADRAWGEWVHRTLENYRVPRHLVGRESRFGPLPRRLLPIFRDREELSSSHDLAASIREALDGSRYLIVLCSPRSAQSHWVNSEIEYFIGLGRRDRILCLVIDGEPGVGAHPQLECLPPALRPAADRPAGLAGGAEPIAADLRPQRDGREGAKLKLLAGMLGVGYDDLRQRERRRQFWRNVRSAVGLALLVIVAGLFWRQQQAEKKAALSEQQRQAHLARLVEVGRQELLDHHEARAALYLNTAYSEGVDTPALRLMLAQSLQAVEAESGSFRVPGNFYYFTAVSPDGKTLAAMGENFQVHIWDRDSGEERCAFQAFNGNPYVYSARQPIFSDDGRLLMMRFLIEYGESVQIHLWDVGNCSRLRVIAPVYDEGEGSRAKFGGGSQRLAFALMDGQGALFDPWTTNAPVRTFQAEAPVHIMALSPDGKRLLTGSDNGSITVWDADSGQALRAMWGHQAAIKSLAFSADGLQVVSGDEAGAVKLWSALTGALVAAAGHDEPITYLAFSGNGQRYLSASRSAVRIWDARTGALIWSKSETQTRDAPPALSDNGMLLLSANDDPVRVWDVDSGRPLMALEGHAGGVMDVSFIDADTVATGGFDSVVKLWRLPAYPLRVFEYDQRRGRSKSDYVAATFLADGEIATVRRNHELRLWRDAENAAPTSVPPPAGGLYWSAVAPVARSLVALSQSGTLTPFDAGQRQWRAPLSHMPGNACDYSLDVSDNGDIVSCTDYENHVGVWNVATQALMAAFEVDNVNAMSLRPDGTAVAYTANQDIHVWSLADATIQWSRAPTSVETQPDALISSLGYSPDGSRLVVTNIAGRAELLDSATGAALEYTQFVSSGNLTQPTFSTDGRWIAFVDEGKGVFLWEPTSGRTRTLTHRSRVRHLRFDHETRFLYTATEDGNVWAWDVQQGILISLLATFRGEPLSFDLNATGDRILIGHSDARASLWRVQAETRDAEDITPVLACQVPWRLEGEALVPHAPEPTACTPRL